MELYTHKKAYEESEKVRKIAEQHKAERVSKGEVEGEPTRDDYENAQNLLFERNEQESSVEYSAETKENIKKLFSLILRHSSLEEEKDDDESWEIEGEISNLQKNIFPFVEKIKSADDFFQELTILDQTIKDIEDRIGMPIDLFNPDSFAQTLKAIDEIQEEKRRDFLTSLDKTSEIDPRVLFLAVQTGITEEYGERFFIYPAKIAGRGERVLYPLCSRLIVRQFINELKLLGYKDEELEKTILNAAPFSNPNLVWDNWEIKVENDKITEEIIQRQQENLNKYFSYKNLPEFQNVAHLLTQKLDVLEFCRRPEAFDKEPKLTPLIDTSSIKEVINNALSKSNISGGGSLSAIILNHHLPKMTILSRFEESNFEIIK